MTGGRLTATQLAVQAIDLAIGELDQAKAAYQLSESMGDKTVVRRMQVDEARRRVDLACRALGELLR